jgi:UDP-N-acetylglucosamine acyltransferase
MVENEVPASTERDYIVEFIRTSERGIMKGYGGGD